ncbi:hypothetical protein BCR44DRAFT_1280418 [Catenaria anguillulae PL171]|uniref:Uncharacterized protein n=1 Tax=Catenaria anguillulae PL171 TaxID=765915 RepID=A0A1Y2HAK8_9FUNG|nr:hypothetical protein BCR44DRAFT_1280418 [Catenaria anguillulae PL171]
MPLPADEIHSLDLFRVRSRGRGGPDNHQQALFIPAVRSLLSHATCLRSLTLSNYGTPTTLQAIVALVAPQLASLSVNIDCGSHFTVLSSLLLPNVTRAKFEEALMCRIGSHMRNPSACVMDCRLPAMPKIEHLELTVSGMREVPLVQMLTGKDYPHFPSCTCCAPTTSWAVQMILEWWPNLTTMRTMATILGLVTRTLAAALAVLAVWADLEWGWVVLVALACVPGPKCRLSPRHSRHA